MQALMSADEYKKFVELSEEGYEAQYKFMEAWRKTNSKFFTEDDRKNAIAWQDYLKETGLLQDGMIASSEEIGKKTGLSFDAVNALNQNLNQFAFGQDIITQTQIDYVDEATEATMNLINAKQALAEAEQNGDDQNLITGLKEDVAKAQADYDAFIEAVPKKMEEAKQALSEGKAETLSEALFGEKDADALAFTETLGTHVEELKDKIQEMEKTHQTGSQTYQDLIAEMHEYEAIQQQIRQDAINNRNRNIGQNVQNINDSKAEMERLKRLYSMAERQGNESAMADLEAQINTIQESVMALDGTQVMIDIELNKEAIDQQIADIESSIDSLEQKKVAIDVTQPGGSTAALQMEKGKQALQAQLAPLKKEQAELESTIKFVKDEASVKDIESTKDDLEKPVNTNVNVKVNGLDTIKTLKETLNIIKTQLSNISVNVTTSVTGNAGSLMKYVGGGSTTSGSYIPGGSMPIRANGTAHADGNWGLASNEQGALVGELGAEGLVRGDKFYLIGKNGPERKNLKKGDILFNHKQTEALLTKGYATERGTLIGSGHALGTIIGSAFRNANNQAKFIDIKGGSSGNSVAKAAKEATDEIKDDINETEKETEEVTDNFIDWIERRIQYVTKYAERYINQTQKVLDRVTNQFYSKQEKGVKAYQVFDKTVNSLYSTATKAQKEVMNTQKSAYDAYTNLTNAVGLDPIYQERVKKGLMEIENITDEALSKQIQQYQDYYDKSQDALDNFIEAAEKFYNMPLDKAATKVENLSNKIEYLGKVLDNTVGYKNRNKVLAEQDTQQEETYKAQKKASKEAEKNKKKATKTAKKAVEKESKQAVKEAKQEVKQQKKEVKAKKTLATASKKAQKEIKKATKENREIDLKKLKKGTKAYTEAKEYNDALKAQKAAKSIKSSSKDAFATGNALNLADFKEGSKAYKAAVQYNAAVYSATEAWNDFKNAEEEWIHWHEVEYPKAAFDNIVNDFNHAVEMINHDFTDYDNKINEILKAGKKLATGYYTEQKKLNEAKMAEYVLERKELEAQLNAIKTYTDEWYDAYNQIKEVDNAISALNISTMELNANLRQLYLDSFQGVRDDIQELISEQEFLLSLMSHQKKTSKDIGYFTDAGLVNLTSKSATASLAQERADNTAKEIKELQELLDKGSLKWHESEFDSVDQLKDKIRELYGTWQSEIKDTYEAQSAIVDLMKERYQAELDMYKQLVSDKKEALSAEKELYEYQKKIAEKTKNIALLQKQLTAYSGDSSLEGQAKRQKLQKDITNAQNDLRDTEYDKYIQDQQQMLDDLIEEYSDRIEKRLEDFNGLLEEGYDLASANSEVTITALNEIAGENGYLPEQLRLFTDAFGSDGTVPAYQKYMQDLFSGEKSPLTGKENSVVSAILKANEVLTSINGQVIALVNGKTAQQNNAGNDPNKTNTNTATATTASNISTIGTTGAGLVVPQGTENKTLATNTYGKVTEDLNATQALDYIKKHAKTGRSPSNGKSFSAVNEGISKFMGTSGKALKKQKVLSTDELKALAKILGVTYNNATKSGNLYKALHNRGIAGFSKGGLVEAIKRNGDDGIATLKVGEAILTPTDSKNLASLAKNFEAIDVTADIMKMLKDGAKSNGGFGTAQNIDYGGVQFNFDLPNVTDPNSFIDTIKNNSNVQKAIQSVSVDRINNGSRLSVNRL